MSMMDVYSSVLPKYINRIQLSVLNCGNALVDKEWKGTVYTPIYTRLYYVVSGKASVSTPEYTLSLTPGNWYLIPAGCTFDYACGGKMEHLFFHIKLSDFDGTDLLRSAKTPLSLPIEEEKYTLWLRCLSGSDMVSGLELRHRVYDILFRFIDTYCIDIHSDDYSPCVFRALQFIKQNLSIQLTVADISQNVFVSKSTLSKYFQKELSLSVKEYVEDSVMSEAMQLLSKTKLPILTVSERLGFSDQCYFSKCFKKKFGKSPREFRKNPYV